MRKKVKIIIDRFLKGDKEIYLRLKKIADEEKKGEKKNVDYHKKYLSRTIVDKFLGKHNYEKYNNLLKLIKPLKTGYHNYEFKITPQLDLAEPPEILINDNNKTIVTISIGARTPLVELFYSKKTPKNLVKNIKKALNQTSFIIITRKEKKFMKENGSYWLIFYGMSKKDFELNKKS